MGLRRNAPAALALDLAAGRRRPGWLGWLLLALGALALAFELLGFAAARADLAERAAIVARLRAELRVNEAARGAGGATAEAERALEAAPARKVAAQLQADWPGLFGSIGAAPAGEVGLLALNADAARGGLRLSGQARSLEAAFAYVGALEAGAAGGALREARIDSHEWVEAGGMTVLAFNASALWGGEERR